MKQFLKALRRVLAGFGILLVLSFLALALIEGYGSKEHELAQALAGKIQAQCTQRGKCPATPDVLGDPQARPEYLEYRLDPKGTRSIVGYKGKPDPDCGYVITGGVEWLPAKQMSCESAEELRWKGMDGTRQTVPVIARAGVAWSALRRMFPVQMEPR